MSRRLGALVVAFALAACAPADTPAALADATTKAVYNADLDGTQAHFDDALKPSVTRESVGALADKMHALGAYKGLKAANSDPERGRYTFEADFDRGTMAVELRVDPDGKIGAYRVAAAHA